MVSGFVINGGENCHESRQPTGEVQALRSDVRQLCWREFHHSSFGVGSPFHHGLATSLDRGHEGSGGVFQESVDLLAGALARNQPVGVSRAIFGRLRSTS